MRSFVYIFICCFVCYFVSAQDNDISVDSLKKFLYGKWEVKENQSCRFTNDTLKRLVIFTKDHFFAEERYQDSILHSWEGDFTIDSVNDRGYIMYITLSPETKINLVNSLLLNMIIFNDQGILVNWYQTYYYKSEQRRCAHYGNYDFYKLDD
jgi:hypothetical protein